MFRKGIAAVGCMAVMAAGWSYAATTWQLQTKLATAGGQIQVRDKALQIAAGSIVYSNFTTSALIPVTVTPKQGYKISSVKKGNVAQTVSNDQLYTVNMDKTGGSPQSIVASFAANQFTVTGAVTGAGSITPATTTVAYNGTVIFSSNPSTGSSILTSVTGGTVKDLYGNAVTLPYSGPVKITAANVTAARAVTANYATVSVSAGSDKVVANNTLATLRGSVTGGGDIAWSFVSGPVESVVLANGTTTQPSFTPAVLGTYVFQARESLRGNTDRVEVVVTGDLAGYMQNACDGCHNQTTGVSPSTAYSKWTVSAHATNGVTCVTCHTEGAMPTPVNSTTVDPVSFTVLNASAGTVGSNYCAKCHSGITTSHNLEAQSNCTSCHESLHNPAVGGQQSGTAAFKGANYCGTCHATVHDQWAQSLHTLKSKKGPALLSGSTENINPWALSNWASMKTYQILGRKANIASKNYVEMYVSVDKKQPQDVAVVIGQDRKQRYAVYYDGSAQQAKVVYSNNGGITFREKMVDHDNDPGTATQWEEVAMPAQPDRAGYTFLWLEVKLSGGTVPAMNGDNYEEWRSWQERCIGCHTTGFDRVAYNAAKSAYTTAFAANGNQPPVGLDMRQIFVTEWEISCEACHGAGEGHKVVSPAKLAKGDHVRREVCESCHTRTNKNVVDTATANDRRGFRIGIDSYSNWIDYTSPAWGSGNRQVSIDGKGRRDHQMTMDIQLSKYIKETIKGEFSYHGNQNCFDCHKSHDVGINKNGQNVWRDNLNAGQYGHSNMKSLASDDGVRSTLRLKDTREALCAPCHVTAAPEGVLPEGVTAPQYTTVDNLIKVFDSKTGATYGYTFDAAAPVLDTALYVTNPTAATSALTLVASNWATEGGRDGRQSHIFNTSATAVATNKAMGLPPAEYTWEVLNANVGSTTASHYTAIWPWANAGSGKTKVYGPLPTAPTSKAPTTSRPWTP